MADTSQGPGWWQASDGKWYPPTSAPAGAPLPPPPPPLPPEPYTGPPSEESAAPPAKPGWTRQQKLILGGIAAALVVLFGAVIIFGAAHKTNNDTADNASTACHEFVKKQLKSPTSASFEDTSTTPDGAGWIVLGTVDSDNSFGANIRGTFRCTVHYRDGNWYGDSVNVT